MSSSLVFALTAILTIGVCGSILFGAGLIQGHPSS